MAAALVPYRPVNPVQHRKGTHLISPAKKGIVQIPKDPSMTYSLHAFKEPKSDGNVHGLTNGRALTLCGFEFPSFDRIPSRTIQQGVSAAANQFNLTCCSVF
jgi:hypothetical protein